MKPVIKYQGGKSKELPLITSLLPSNYSRLIEPFCGGSAVSFSLTHSPCWLNDMNELVINLYRVIGSNEYSLLQRRVNEIKAYNHDELSDLYYQSRDIINSSFNFSPYERALSFIVVRQLCFSGMERYNSSGSFNVPFGHYKSFSCNLSPSHHEFLSSCSLTCDDGIDIVASSNEDDFLFLDPPYLNRLGYSNGDGGEKLHHSLVKAMKQSRGRWLFVHSDCEFYRNVFSDYNILSHEFVYSQRWGRNKNHSNSKVNHIYVTNYDTD